MKVSIFQPTYLPWLGFFKAIQAVDQFVILDDVQFEHHSWQHRNRIKSAAGLLMLTVPIVRAFPIDINKVEINYQQDWKKKHLRAIEINYCKTPFFEDFFPILRSFYDGNAAILLIDLNMKIIRGICDFLTIDMSFIYSSRLNVKSLHKNEKVVAILKELGADSYLHAEGATDYMVAQTNLYQKAGVRLIPLKFEHPVYPQLYGNFISHLSIIDVIFNCGREQTIQIIKDIKLTK